MNKLIKYKKDRRRLRKLRNLIKGDSQKPRIVLYKSNRYLTAQAIDDQKGHTLFYLNSNNLETINKEKPECRKNKEWAKKLGEATVEKLREKSVKKVVFDRNGYPYHGKIQSFCEPLHSAGLLGGKKHD
jgi:large subunit ribosomal protein L18